MTIKINFNMQEIADALSTDEVYTYVNEAGTQLIMFSKEDGILITFFGSGFNDLSEKELGEELKNRFLKFIGLDDIDDAVRRAQAEVRAKIREQSMAEPTS